MFDILGSKEKVPKKGSNKESFINDLPYDLDLLGFVEGPRD